MDEVEAINLKLSRANNIWDVIDERASRAFDKIFPLDTDLREWLNG